MQFVDLVENCGETIVEATKTSIAFKSPGLFTVVHFQKNGLKVSFWLPRRIDPARISRIEAISSQEYVHNVKLTSLDDQLQNWLCEAYALACEGISSRNSRPFRWFLTCGLLPIE